MHYLGFILQRIGGNASEEESVPRSLEKKVMLQGLYRTVLQKRS
jgi:hypothetical protein